MRTGASQSKSSRCSWWVRMLTFFCQKWRAARLPGITNVFLHHGFKSCTARPPPIHPPPDHPWTTKTFPGYPCPLAYTAQTMTGPATHFRRSHASTADWPSTLIHGKNPANTDDRGISSRADRSCFLAKNVVRNQLSALSRADHACSSC